MIAVDTNVLVRYFIDDAPDQTEVATEFLESHLSASNPGYITLVALADLFWVLRRGYRLPYPDAVVVIQRLLRTPQIVVEQAALVEAALASKHRELGDVFIHAVGRANGCSRTVTFDRAFARLDGVDLLA